jgi:hypothetical protein
VCPHNELTCDGSFLLKNFTLIIVAVNLILILDGLSLINGNSVPFSEVLNKVCLS